MLSSGETVSLVMPAKNERPCVDLVLSSVPDFYDEVIVVDNGSTDGTQAAVCAFGDPRVRLLSCELRDRRGIGYGATLVMGLSAATGDWLVTADFDGTYPIDCADGAIRACRGQGLDAGIIVRHPDRRISRKLALGVGVLNLELFVLYGWRCQDSLSGMVMLRSALFSEMSEHVEWAVGWDFSPQVKVEMLRAVGRSGVLQLYHLANERVGSDTKQNYWVTGFGHLVWILRDWLSHGCRRSTPHGRLVRRD